MNPNRSPKSTSPATVKDKIKTTWPFHLWIMRQLVLFSRDADDVWECRVSLCTLDYDGLRLGGGVATYEWGGYCTALHNSFESVRVLQREQYCVSRCWISFDKRRRCPAGASSSSLVTGSPWTLDRGAEIVHTCVEVASSSNFLTGGALDTCIRLSPPCTTG